MEFQQKFVQKQSQKLAMTQQLQQSIQILQYNNEELISFLNNKALENPLLEVSDPMENMDMGYADIHLNNNYIAPKRAFDEQENEGSFSNIPYTYHSLFEFLLNQIHLNYRDIFLRDILLYMVEFVDVNGYLRVSLKQIEEAMQATSIQVLDALTLLQQLDPAGVGARNLQECLMLQTERDEHAPELTYIILEEDFEDFAKRQWESIAKKYQVSLIEIQKISDYVQHLSAFPGAGFDEIHQQIIYPDLILKNNTGQLSLLSTKINRPALKFQKQYYHSLQTKGDPEVNQYLKTKKSEYEWIKNSLQQRESTILLVGKK